MSEFEIEEGVPLPSRKTGITAATPWPWPEMEVNQSVFIPAKKGETASNIRSRVTPHHYGRKNDKTFKTRWMKRGDFSEMGLPAEEKRKLGVRVWRTK